MSTINPYLKIYNSFIGYLVHLEILLRYEVLFTYDVLKKLVTKPVTCPVHPEIHFIPASLSRWGGGGEEGDRRQNWDKFARPSRLVQSLEGYSESEIDAVEAGTKASSYTLPRHFLMREILRSKTALWKKDHRADHRNRGEGWRENKEREREREERLYAIINTRSKMAEVETEWLMTSLPAFFRPLCRLIMSCPIERSETLSVWKASTCERKWTLRHEAIKKWLAFKTRPVTFLCLFVFWRRRRSFFCSNRVFRLEEDLQECNWGDIWSCSNKEGLL